MSHVCWPSLRFLSGVATVLPALVTATALSCSHGEARTSPVATGTTVHSVLGDSVAVTLSSVPKSFQPSAAIEIPSELPDAEPFDLEVRRSVATGGSIGVFTRPIVADPPTAPEKIGAVGPAGLEAVRAPDNGKEVRLVSRDLSPDQLLEVATAIHEHEMATALPSAAWPVIAKQSPASVPGIGSLPLPPSHGTAASWTTESTDEGVRGSIGVGAHVSTGDDLDVLRWWLGVDDDGTDRIRARFPAYRQVGEPDSLQPPVPDATLEAWSEGSLIVMVRVVGFEGEALEEVVRSVRRATPAEWSSLRSALNASQPTVLLSESGPPEWRLINQQSPNPMLCLESNSQGKTDRTCSSETETRLTPGMPVPMLVPPDSSLVVLFGSVGSEVIQVVARDETSELARVPTKPWRGGGAFAMAITTGPPVEVLGLDRAGQVVISTKTRRS